jgi:hypothetical protein
VAAGLESSYGDGDAYITCCADDEYCTSHGIDDWFEGVGRGFVQEYLSFTSNGSTLQESYHKGFIVGQRRTDMLI